MLTVILKVLTTLPELATECLALLGEGARPDATQEETFFALCNTPVQHGYIRIPVAEHIAAALQYMQDNGITSAHAEIFRVEWFGQDMLEDTLIDDYGTEIIGYREAPFIVGHTVAQNLEDGSFVPEQSIYLGRMGQ